MRVTVLLFARLRELAGTSTWSGDVDPGSTVADVWRALARDHQAVTAMTGSVSAAVNSDFARMEAVVTDGDEIAFLPPVSGGSWIPSR